MRRFAICCGIIFAMMFISYIPEVLRYTNTVPGFDKYMHVTAGAILMFGFPGAWRRTWKLAFGALLLWNIAWESYEVFGYYAGAFQQISFDKAWLIDTAGDIFITMLGGMIVYVFLCRKIKS